MVEEFIPIDLKAFLPVDITDKRLKHKQWPYYPKEGIALSLSGGGYRAMLFHLGSLWRLKNQDEITLHGIHHQTG